MPRTHARITTSIWTNDDFRKLDAATQRTYLLLVSQPDLSICGVLDYNPKRLSRLAADSKPAQITRAVHTLEERRYVVVDDETDELAIRTFLRHDGVLDMPNPLKAAARAWKSIHSDRIRAVVLDALPPPIRAIWPEPLTKMDPKAIGALLKEPFTSTLGGTLHPNPSPEPLREPPGSLSLTLSGPLSSSPPTANGSPHNPAAPASKLDDDLQPLWTLLAQRRAELEHPNGHGIGHLPSYMTALVNDHRTRLTDQARTLHDEHPDWTVEQLADDLDPDTANRAGNYMTADETAAWLADQQARAAEAVPMPEHMRPA